VPGGGWGLAQTKRTQKEEGVLSKEGEEDGMEKHVWTPLMRGKTHAGSESKGVCPLGRGGTCRRCPGSGLSTEGASMQKERGSEEAATALTLKEEKLLGQRI